MKFRRILSSIIILIMLVSSVPFAMAADITTVIACSDFQNESGNDSGKTAVQGIVSTLKTNGITSADGFLCCGDYDYEYTDTAGGVNAIKEAVSDVVTENMVFVQGNHDSSIGTNGMSQSGNNDPESKEYGVFVINEDDYMWNNTYESTVQKTAQNLADYLNEKLESGYDKPIFVLSHLALNYNMRTYYDGDGKYANYIFDVLNTAGAKGLNIIFLFGHNHSNGWDDYLGGSAVYLKKGDKMLVAQKSQTVFKECTLNFTYMNAGYIGYYRNVNGADDTLTMTVFKISDNNVEIARYSKDGIHNLKSKGVTNSYKNETAYNPDTTVYTSPQNVALTSVTDKTPITDVIKRPTSGKTTGEYYTRITNVSQLKDGGKYLLVYNSSPDYIMIPSVVTISSRQGFEIKSSVDFGGNVWIDSLSQYLWTFRKSGAGWKVGTSAGNIKFTSTSNLAITATLESAGDTLTIGGNEDAFTFSNGSYLLNYNSRGLINGYASNPAAFYIYELTGYTVEIEGGASDVDHAKAGETVTITAGDAPDMCEFDCWEYVTGSGYINDVNSAVTTITMPSYAVQVKVKYKTVDGYQTGDCGAGINWLLNENTGVLTINGKGAMPDYTKTSCPWADYITLIKTVTISEGITAVGNYSFYGAKNLTSISLPSTLEDIGNSVFYNCSSLNSIDFPDAVTNIGTSTFRGCTSLENVRLPKGITTVGSYFFYGCTALKEITIPENVKILGTYSFRGCTSLKTLHLPKGITTVNNYAFYLCSALTDIYFDGKEEEISVTVNSNNDPFNNATKHYKTELITGTAGSNATFTFDPDTAVLTITGTGTLWGPGLEAAKRPLVKEVVIEGLTSISANIFSGAHFTSLEKVTLPEGLTSLGKGAFTDCKKLSEINLPTTLTSIGELCFYNCKSLTKIDIPENVTSIGNSAFLGVVASDINYAGTRAMWDAVTIGTNNARLSFVACSDDVRTILDKATKGDGAWIFNEANETLYFAGNTNYIKSYAEGAEMVPDEIAVKVKYIDIDETLGGFGAYTFSNMTNVISVTGGENIRYVGNYAFKNCTSLKTVEFTNSQYFGGIPYGLFANCTSLETAELSDSIVFLYGASFQGCSSLKEITIPAGAKAVGEYTFRNCTALETITLEEGITSFGAGAIQGCTSLKTINFPSTLKTIGQYAFYNVPSTITVNFNGTQSQWNTVYVREGNAALNYLTVNCK